MKKNTLFIMSFFAGMFAVLFELNIFPYGPFAVVFFISLSIFLRIFGTNLSLKATGIENKGSDIIFSLSAAIWFILVIILKYVVSLLADFSFATLNETFGKSVDIIVLTLIASLVLNKYFYSWNKPYKEYKKILRAESKNSDQDLLQKYRRYVNAVLGIPFFLAVFPGFLTITLNLLLAFPRLLEAIDDTRAKSSMARLLRISKMIDVESRLWAATDIVAITGKVKVASGYL